MDEKEIISRISENIRLQRYRKHITQENLAEQVNISTKYMNLIENKKANPTITIIVKICEVLNLSLEKLLKDNN